MLQWLSVVCVFSYLRVLCLTVLVNYLLIAFDICMDKVIVFS